MEINVDTIESNKKNNEIKKKETIKESKKKEKTIKSMFKKTPINASTHITPSLPSIISNNFNFEYQPTEWMNLSKDGMYKILSLPAGADAVEFEQELRNSKDINHMINQDNFLFNYILNNADNKVLYGLSYGSLLAKTKIKNYNRNKIVAKTVDLQKIDNNNISKDKKDIVLNEISVSNNLLDRL